MTHSWAHYETVKDILNDSVNQTMELCGKAQHLATLINGIEFNGSRIAMITTETATVEQFKNHGIATDRLILRFAMNSVEIENTLNEILPNRPKFIIVELPKHYDGTRFGLLAFIEETAKKYPSIRFILLSDYEDAKLPSPAITRMSIREESSVFMINTIVTLFKVQRVPVLRLFHKNRLCINFRPRKKQFKFATSSIRIGYNN